MRTVYPQELSGERLDRGYDLVDTISLPLNINILGANDNARMIGVSGM